MSAIRAEPEQTPFPSGLMQFPLNLNVPEAQIKQSFDVGPEHVLHDGEQTLQAAPLPKVPSGHGLPADVADFGAMHFVLSLASKVKSVWQEMQVPVPSAHAVQPS